MISSAILRTIVVPFVRLLVRRGVTFPAFSKAAKEAFVEVAREELLRTGKKLNGSRLAAVTGLHRSEIAKMQAPQDGAPNEDSSLLAKVLGTWEHDKRFSTTRGKPRVLSFGFEKSDFSTLVRTVHTHLHASTVLAELERCGVVEKVEGGVSLKKSTLLLDSNPGGSLQYFSKDVETLAETIEFNVTHPQLEKKLHIRTEFDNIAPERLAELQTWVLEQGRAFHKKMREHLSQFDRDLEPVSGSDPTMRGKVVVTAFAWSEIFKSKE